MDAKIHNKPKTTRKPEEPWPKCGMEGCDFPAAVVDDAGVGFCQEHEDCSPCGSVIAATSIFDFDPWWRTRTAANAGLDYGEWLPTETLPADASPGWGLPT